MLSLFLFCFRNRPTASLWCLFAAAFLLRFWAAGLDPYLNDWDERFHAIVAKNMLEAGPWKPVLRLQPIMPYDYTAWCCNYVWLHKQPLFLWQMAGSMGVFGVHLWSLRLPGVLMGALLVFVVSRMGTLLRDRETGFYAAFLYAGAYHQLELTSGLQGMEHNDLAFLFYVTLSLWAYLEYESNSHSRRWAIWLGVFAGAAVLCKWLAGLLVFGIWGLNWLFGRSPGRRAELGLLLGSAAVAAAVFLPWQLYTQLVFPAEAAHERAFNTLHIFQVVEGHAGGWDYYFNYFKYHYGAGSWIPAVAGLALCFFTVHAPRMRNILLLGVALVYGFFSLVAQTKLPSYVYFIAPVIYLLFGLSLRALEGLLRGRWPESGRQLAVALLLAGGFYLSWQPRKLIAAHLQPATAWEQNRRQRKLANTAVYRRIESLVPPGYVVFNCPSFEDTEAMFFSRHQAYGWTPDPAEFARLKSLGVRLAVFDAPGGMQAPDYIRNDPDVLLIREKLLLE